MDLNLDSITVTDNEEAQRFEAQIGDLVSADDLQKLLSRSSGAAGR